MPTLNWIGKDKVVNHHLDVPFRTLEKKYNFASEGQDDGGNMIIHGDNLDALKALLPKYEGRVKCIYIDPPYNTGNEGWVYNDNVNDPKIRKWLGEVVGKEGEDLSRHDKWLCMMYPRLKLLYKLLAEDGAIFVSIDYHEQPFLRLILDEIFGRSNFVSEIACVNKPSGRSDDKYVATAHESIIIYRKSWQLEFGGFEPEEHITCRYNKVAPDGRKYREEDLRKRGAHDERIDRPNLFYPFYFNQETGELLIGDNEDETPAGFIRIEPMKTAEVEGTWRWSKETAAQQMFYIHPRYMPNKQQWSLFEWEYLDERDSVKPTTHWDFKDVNSERGTEMFSKFLGFNKTDFPNPKPVGTIERILRMVNDPNAIILDSFAGSGTTAHAVLNINKQDGGHRKFILVEMMDYANSITAERVKRVISGYGEDKKAVPGTGGGFSYYELGEPLLVDGLLNPNVPEEKIREYVCYTETRQPMSEPSADEKHLLGVHDRHAYYFYYEPDQLTTLNKAFLRTIKTRAEGYLIYADVNMLSAEEMEKFHISFKKIPRDIALLQEREAAKMELKNYQKRVLRELDAYMSLLNSTQSLNAAYNKHWEQLGIAVGFSGLPPYNDVLPGVPHVCFKVPTGGGKTLLACAALRHVFGGMGMMKTKAVVWLVPSNAILEQTLRDLRNPEHPYRQQINFDFSSRVEVYDGAQALNGQSLSPASVQENLSIFVLSYDALRIKKKDGRKVYQENGNLAQFVPHFTDRDALIPDVDETALIQVLNQMSPVVIVDESHNAQSELSIEMLKNLNPSFVLDLTATPKKNSNIISIVDARELKKENMVKLPVIIYNRQTKDDVLIDAIQRAAALKRKQSWRRSRTAPTSARLCCFRHSPRARRMRQPLKS